jgi:DegV family protein with EDD domain
MTIALVTDSTADIPINELQTHRIHVVPNLVIIDGKSLVDGIDISREEFYQLLPEMATPPTTSTASIGAYENMYQKLFSDGAEQIISIHASSLLSGIFNAASTTARAFGDRIKVIDSGQLSLGIGFQVLAAADAVSAGASLDEVIRTIKDVQQRVRVIAMLDTLEYVRRSGRVSWARARLGDFLRVKPFLEVREGQVLSLGETRTRRKGIDRLKGFLLSLGSLERLAILHTNAETDAHQFLSEIQQEFSSLPFIVNVTTVIGTHVGPNGLGFAAVMR